MALDVRGPRVGAEDLPVPLGEPGGEVRLGDDELGLGVVEQEAEPFRRVAGVQRQVGGAGLEHAEQGDDHVRVPLGVHADHGLGSCPELAQLSGQPVRPGVELGVGEFGRVAEHRERVGGFGRLPFDELLHALLARVVAHGPVPVHQHAPSLRGAQRGERVVRPVRPGHRGQRGEVVVADRQRLRVVQLAGTVVEGQRQAARAGVADEPGRKGEVVRLDAVGDRDAVLAGPGVGEPHVAVFEHGVEHLGAAQVSGDPGQRITAVREHRLGPAVHAPHQVPPPPARHVHPERQHVQEETGRGAWRGRAHGHSGGDVAGAGQQADHLQVRREQHVLDRHARRAAQRTQRAGEVVRHRRLDRPVRGRAADAGRHRRPGRGRQGRQRVAEKVVPPALAVLRADGRLLRRDELGERLSGRGGEHGRRVGEQVRVSAQDLAEHERQALPVEDRLVVDDGPVEIVLRPAVQHAAQEGRLREVERAAPLDAERGPQMPLPLLLGDAAQVVDLAPHRRHRVHELRRLAEAAQVERGAQHGVPVHHVLDGPVEQLQVEPGTAQAQTAGVEVERLAPAGQRVVDDAELQRGHGIGVLHPEGHSGRPGRRPVCE